MELHLNDKPTFPKGLEKYQGLTVAQFIQEPRHLLVTFLKKTGYILSDEVHEHLRSHHTVKQPSTHFA